MCLRLKDGIVKGKHMSVFFCGGGGGVDNIYGPSHAHKNHALMINNCMGDMLVLGRWPCTTCREGSVTISCHGPSHTKSCIMPFYRYTG